MKNLWKNIEEWKDNTNFEHFFLNILYSFMILTLLVITIFCTIFQIFNIVTLKTFFFCNVIYRTIKNVWIIGFVLTKFMLSYKGYGVYLYNYGFKKIEHYGSILIIRHCLNLIISSKYSIIMS